MMRTFTHSHSLAPILCSAAYAILARQNEDWIKDNPQKNAEHGVVAPAQAQGTPVLQGMPVQQGFVQSAVVSAVAVAPLPQTVTIQVPQVYHDVLVLSLCERVQKLILTCDAFAHAPRTHRQGVVPGQQIQVPMPNGQTVTIVVPAGVVAGQQLQIPVPSALVALS